jgi:UDP-glucose 4-epimerase
LKILVTGGAGFIASHVADAYVNAGHSVFVVDDLSMGRRENINPEAQFIQMDIRSEKIRDIFRREQFDVVNHHAAQMDVRKSVEDPTFDASVNILGTINLLECAREIGMKKFIFASTGGAIYGEQDYYPADEEHPQRPLSPYGISKLAIEKYLYYYQQVYELPYVILRYANVYGPRQNPQGEAGVVAIFTSRMLAGQQPIINGDGKQTRDYVFIDDIVKANVLALDHMRSDIFNIGTSVESDVNKLFNTLKRLTGSGCEEKHGPAKKGEQLRSVLQWTKAKTALGWIPSIPLNEGLKQTVDFFRNNIRP